MLQENEIITLLIGLGVGIFIIVNRVRLKRLPHSGLLFAGYGLLLSGWSFTIMEGFGLRPVFNFIEHLSFMLSSLLVALWCWKVFIGERGRDL